MTRGLAVLLLCCAASGAAQAWEPAAADGVVDGLTQNFQACKAFDPAVLQCSGSTRG